MNEIIPANYLHAIGWMLVHSLWQIAGLGLFLWFTLEIYQKKSAAFKYKASVFVLFLLIVSSIGTALFYFEPEKESTIAYELVYEGENNLFPTTVYSNNSHTPRTNFEVLSSQIEKRIPFLVNLWFIGVILFMIKFAGSLTELRNLGQKPKKGIPERWQVALTEFSKKLKIKHSVKIFQSNHIDTPLTFGVLKPVILIPAGLVFQLSPMQMEAIIAHELAHIKRHDYLINLMQSAMEVIFFYHPVFWYINKIIKTERENACDDTAINIGVNARDLAEALVLVVQHAKQTQPLLALAAAKSKTPTLDRIKRIMGIHSSQKQTSTLTSLTMLSTLLLSVSLILGANADKSINEDLELILTEIHSEIDLGEDFLLQLGQKSNPFTNEPNDKADDVKQIIELPEIGQIEPSSSTKDNISEPLNESNTKKNLFDFKVNGETVYVGSNIKGSDSKILIKPLNKDILSYTMKIAPLEFEGMDFSAKPNLGLSDATSLSKVSIDTTKSLNSNSGKIRIGYDANVLANQNMALTKTSTNIKAYSVHDLSRIKKTTSVGFNSNPNTLVNIKKDTTDYYNKVIDKAILKLSNADTAEEKEAVLKELSTITNKMTALTMASKQLISNAKNDSIFSYFKTQAELYKLKAEEMKPIMVEYQQKMIEWQKEQGPLIKEYQERMEAYEKELRPLMEEYQEKMKSFQKELQPLLNEYQQKMFELQKDYTFKMKELQEKQAKENN
ncbi:M56 family metallopeptidase [Belliella sp. R4-6]|uniref:M56 family metallopeptidase n=1 Tax=Belliella alkalica TaxID=1730871 RepID=A0ABS9VAI8_9BACT|nr:M56 family metallopeptidase [Belliella alkalica]MCH7413421.1 M56 family metallopeptidase [Belliella alkalica]